MGGGRGKEKALDGTKNIRVNKKKENGLNNKLLTVKKSQNTSQKIKIKSVQITLSKYSRLSLRDL